MNIFYHEHRIILEALLQKNVDFMLIGGYAVNYYGYNRVTGDMDIWLRPDNSNKDSLLDALNNIGFDDAGIATIRSWDFTQPQKFHIGKEKQPDQTEFMTHISGVGYDEAKQNTIIANIDGLSLPFINYSSLIQNKRSTGRTKDITDIEYLEKIMHLKHNKH
jgi:hypothetical protein